MSKTIPITFSSGEGLKLFGILHKPSLKSHNGVGIIFLTAGIKSRVAPHRLYVKMARGFCQNGFQVFRFDPYGMGDSEGEVPERRSEEYFASIQVGKYVEDTISAINWMERECGCSKFILAGLCGGAITALLTARRDHRVAGIISLGIPVLIEGGNENYFKIMSSRALEHHYEGYIKKIFSLNAWLRFITFQSAHRVIFKSLVNKIFPRFFAHRQNKTHKNLQISGGLNPYFFPALKSIVSSKRQIFLIFAEKDRIFWEFEEKIYNPNRNFFDHSKGCIEIHVEKGANHILSFKECYENVFKMSISWLKKHYGNED